MAGWDLHPLEKRGLTTAHTMRQRETQEQGLEMQETDYIVIKNCRFNEESGRFWVGCREFVRRRFRLILLRLLNK